MKRVRYDTAFAVKTKEEMEELGERVVQVEPLVMETGTLFLCEILPLEGLQ